MGSVSRRSVPFQICVPILVIVITTFVGFWWPDPFENVDAKIYDFKLSHAASGGLNTAIVHLDVSDASLKKIGQWPWDREVAARVVDRLSEAGAALIVFDIFYSHPGKSATGDERLFKAILEAGDIISPTGISIIDQPVHQIQYVGNDARARARALLDRALVLSQTPRFDPPETWRLDDSIMPLSPILRNSKGIGHIKSTPDADGVHRRVPLLVKLEDRFVPSLAFAALIAYLKVNPQDITFDRQSEITVKHPRGVLKIPVDTTGRMLVKWEFRQFPAYVVEDLLTDSNESVKLDRFKNKIVLFAMSATGATDFGTSPLAKECMMSRLHSYALNTMLTQSFIRSLPAFPFVMIVAIVVSAAFAVASVPIRMTHGILLAVGMSALFCVFVFLAFTHGSWEIPTVLPLLTFALSATAALAIKGVTTESKANKVAFALQRYLSPQMLESIIRQEKQIDLSTRRKELTILFADIEGFSRLSEIVEVDYVGAFLNEFFEAMTNVVFEHKGTIDKFLGDGFLAFFGDPVDLENHALSALKAGDQMLKEMSRLNAKWSSTGIKAFEEGIHIRIGVNTGVVIVGNVGSVQRMEYTVVGSAVNVASRLQAKAPSDGVLMSARTYALAKDHISTGKAQTIRVKNIDRDLTVYELESISYT